VETCIAYSAGKSAFMELEVAGRRRDDSSRRFEIPASLLNDELDLPTRWLLEKLLGWAELEGGYS